MKKVFVLIAALLILTGMSFARERKPVPTQTSDQFFFLFNEGVSGAMTTRIINEEDYARSNFVWQDYLVGLFYEMETVNMKPVDCVARFALYYPLYHTFNGMTQVSSQVLLYGGDLFLGPVLRIDRFNNIADIELSLGPHGCYLLSDEYHHVEIGLGAMAGLSFPLTKRCNILLQGFASYDNGNFGTNKKIQPYDHVFQYQASLGFCFSRKKINPHPYF